MGYMKRSEMIDNLQGILDNRHPLDGPIDANEILNLIEKFGMLPPEAKFIDERIGTHWDNQWEPEEETEDDDNYCGAW